MVINEWPGGGDRPQQPMQQMSGKTGIPVSAHHQQANRRFNPYQLPVQHVRQVQSTRGVSSMQPTVQNGQLNGNTHTYSSAVHSNQAILQNQIQSCQMNGTNIAVNSLPSVVVRQNGMRPHEMLNPKHHLQGYTASVPTGQCGNFKSAHPQQCHASNTRAPINGANIPRHQAVNSSQGMQHAAMHRSSQTQPLQVNRMQPVRLQVPGHHPNGGMEVSSQQMLKQMQYIPNTRVQIDHSRKIQHLNDPSCQQSASMVNQASVAGRSQSVPLSHMNINTSANYDGQPTTANIQRHLSGDTKLRLDLQKRQAPQRYYIQNELSTLLQTPAQPQNQLSYILPGSTSTQAQMQVQNIDPNQLRYSTETQVQRKMPVSRTRRSHPLMTYPMSVTSPVYRGQIPQQQQVRPLNNTAYQQRSEQMRYTQEQRIQGNEMQTSANPRRIMQRRWSLPQEQILGQNTSRYLATSPLTQAMNQEQQHQASPAPVYRNSRAGMRSYSAPSPNYNRGITNGGGVQSMDSQLDTFMQNNGQIAQTSQYQYRRTPAQGNAPHTAHAGSQVMASGQAYIQSNSSAMAHPHQQHPREISQNMLNQITSVPAQIPYLDIKTSTQSTEITLSHPEPKAGDRQNSTSNIADLNIYTQAEQRIVGEANRGSPYEENALRANESMNGGFSEAVIRQAPNPVCKADLDRVQRFLERDSPTILQNGNLNGDPGAVSVKPNTLTIQLPHTVQEFQQLSGKVLNNNRSPSVDHSARTIHHFPADGGKRPARRRRSKNPSTSNENPVSKKDWPKADQCNPPNVTPPLSTTLPFDPETVKKNQDGGLNDEVPTFFKCNLYKEQVAQKMQKHLKLQNDKKKLPIVYVPKERSPQVPSKQSVSKSENLAESTHVLTGEAHEGNEIQTQSDTVGVSLKANTDFTQLEAHRIPNDTANSRERASDHVEKKKTEHSPVIVGEGDLSLLKPTIDLFADINVCDHLQVGRTNEPQATQSSRSFRNPEIYRWEKEIESFVRGLSDKISSSVDVRETSTNINRYPDTSGFKGNCNKSEDLECLVTEIADVYWDLYDSLCFEKNDAIDTAGCGTETGTLVRCGSS